MHDLQLRLAINRMTGLRPHEKLQLEDLVDSERFFSSLTAPLLSRITGRPIAENTTAPDDLLRLAERDLRYIRSNHVHVIPCYDAKYPAMLREIYDPPYLLYLRGELPAWESLMIAVVGTRNPGAEAVISAMQLGRELSSDGVYVISGLARGIDCAAHQGALSAGGLTGAVLGSGIDAVTPYSSRETAARMLDAGGFLLSEYAPGVHAAKYHFPARNRIISGLSRGVVIVQAPAKSGALITADYALDHGRDLFVHSVGVSGVASAGSSELAADGALIIDSARDIYAEWGIAPEPRFVAAVREVPVPVDSREAGRQLAEELRFSLQGSGRE